jgi:hypothetical protein
VLGPAALAGAVVLGCELEVVVAGLRPENGVTAGAVVVVAGWEEDDVVAAGLVKLNGLAAGFDPAAAGAASG